MKDKHFVVWHYVTDSKYYTEDGEYIEEEPILIEGVDSKEEAATELASRMKGQGFVFIRTEVHDNGSISIKATHYEYDFFHPYHSFNIN